MNTPNRHHTLHPSGPECARYTETLPQFRQGILAPADAASLSAHMATCAYCRARLATYDGLDTALGSYLRQFVAAAPSADDLVEVAMSRQKESEMADTERDTDTRDEVALPPAHPSPTAVGRTARGARPHPALAVIAAILLVGLAATLFATISRTNNGPTHNGVATATTAPTATTIPRLPPTPLHLPAGATLLGLSMASPSDGWAVGLTADMNDIILVRYHDGQWVTWQGSLPKMIVSPSMVGISMDSPTDGWLAGFAGLLHYTNDRWVAVPVPGVGAVEDVRMVSPTDGWARTTLMATDSNQDEGLLHYSNGAWSQVALPAGLDTLRGAISFTFSVTPTGECWLMYSDANSGVTKILRYTDGAFQLVSTLSHMQGETLTMHSARDGWLTGTDAGGKAVYHFDGSNWTKVAIPASFQQQRYLYGVELSPSGQVWLFGGSSGNDTGAAARYLNGAWELVKIPSSVTPFTLNLVADDEGWALDTYPHRAAIYHYQNGSWTQYPN